MLGEFADEAKDDQLSRARVLAEDQVRVSEETEKVMKRLRTLKAADMSE